MDNIAQTISKELGLKAAYVENIIKLFDEGNSIPFIARYRKEMHGAMDDTTLRELFDRLNYLRSLNERRESIRALIDEQGKLSEELAQAIDRAETLAKLEDLYRPYKQKRRTRAVIAKEKGLEPLATALLLQSGSDPSKLAEAYIGGEKGAASAAEALAGASDIIAEMFSDDAETRDELRAYLKEHSSISSSAAKEEDSVYSMYYDFSQPYSKMQAHQTLAINRGEKEGFIKVKLVCDEDRLKKNYAEDLSKKNRHLLKYLKKQLLMHIQD